MRVAVRYTSSREIHEIFEGVENVQVIDPVVDHFGPMWFKAWGWGPNPNVDLVVTLFENGEARQDGYWLDLTATEE